MFDFTYGSYDPRIRNITRNNFRVIRLPSRINLSICESELAAPEKKSAFNEVENNPNEISKININKIRVYQPDPLHPRSIIFFFIKESELARPIFQPINNKVSDFSETLQVYDDKHRLCQCIVRIIIETIRHSVLSTTSFSRGSVGRI